MKMFKQEWPGQSSFGQSGTISGCTCQLLAGSMVDVETLKGKLGCLQHIMLSQALCVCTLYADSSVETSAEFTE